MAEQNTDLSGLGACVQIRAHCGGYHHILSILKQLKIKILHSLFYSVLVSVILSIYLAVSSSGLPVQVFNLKRALDIQA